ncbi:MAG: hypothetical protein QXT28_12615 [Thermofilaceae archaeon]
MRKVKLEGREYVVDAPLTVAHLIEKAYEEDGFRGFIVTGPQGAGKTVLTLWTLYLIYRDWDLVFEHVIFDWQNHFSKIERWIEVNAGRGGDYERYAALAYDDAAVQFSKYLFYVDKALSWSISQYFQLVRRFAAGVIVTCVDEEELLRPLRLQPFSFIEVKRLGKWTSVAKFYQPVKKPLSKRRARVIGAFAFTPLLPDEVYERYRELNFSYTQRSPLITEAKRILERLEKRLAGAEDTDIKPLRAVLSG